MRFKDIIFSSIYKDLLAFGLDISDFSIKVAQLERKGKNFELNSYNRISIPEEIIEAGKIRKEKELIEILKKSVTETKGESIRTPYVVCSLPEQHGFVKIIQLPKMKLREIREAIKWEAEANIPLSLDEVYLDWQIIPPKRDQDHVDVLINAAPRELVDSYLNVLKAADLEPVVFEIESVATARALIKNEFAPKPILIVDLGFSRTSFIAFAENNLCFTTSVSVSNQQMINDIAKKLDIEFKEAQKMKFEAGLDIEKENAKVLAALLPSLKELVGKVREYIVFYKNQALKKEETSDEISEIILCGGGAYLKGLAGYLSKHLSIPVKLGNPWVNISRPNNKEFNTILKESLSYSTALGLALRGMKQL